MIIKWSGDDVIRLPDELLPLEGELLRLLKYDRYVMGESWNEFFVHITIHMKISTTSSRSSIVRSASGHRCIRRSPVTPI